MFRSGQWCVYWLRSCCNKSNELRTLFGKRTNFFLKLLSFPPFLYVLMFISNNLKNTTSCRRLQFFSSFMFGCSPTHTHAHTWECIASDLDLDVGYVDAVFAKYCMILMECLLVCYKTFNTIANISRTQPSPPSTTKLTSLKSSNSLLFGQCIAWHSDDALALRFSTASCDDWCPSCHRHRHCHFVFVYFILLQTNEMRNSQKEIGTFNENGVRNFVATKDTSRDFSNSQDNTDRGSMSDQAFAYSASSVESLPSASGSSK